MSLGSTAIHTKGKALCGVCGNKMVKIPLPPTPYYALRDESTTPVLIGRVGHTPKTVLDKLYKEGGEIIEIVPVQYGCLDDETIHTFWFRKDGQQGDLWRTMQARASGDGPEVVREMPGTLEGIDESI